MRITRETKALARRQFNGSQALFEACWNHYKRWLNGAIDDPDTIDDILGWLDSIAAEKVNNPKSKFYIYGLLT